MLSKVYRNKINQVLNSKEKRIGMFLSVFIIIGISGECKIFCVNRKKEVPSVE